MNKTVFQGLPVLKPGDSIDLIAPASRCTSEQLHAMQALLTGWKLNCHVPADLFGDDLFCANTDAARFKHLQNAFFNKETKAIFCARGGYGSMRLIPELSQMRAPESVKLFIGMSDTTALQLFLQQHWHWPTIHGAAAPDRFSTESIAALKSLLFGETEIVQFAGLLPLNQAATQQTVVKGNMTGGNLCLIQAGVGTIWQVEGKDKIILLEEVNERGYRIDRMLEHLRQASIFRHAAAIVFGDFLGGEEPNGTSLVLPTLIRFAQRCEIPVVQVKGIGHGRVNFPIPLGTHARLQLGNNITLSCSR